MNLGFVSWAMSVLEDLGVCWCSAQEMCIVGCAPRRASVLCDGVNSGYRNCTWKQTSMWGEFTGWSIALIGGA